ncbi:MAG: D-alanyl-D-alanine carboxypeptidase, partial [Acidimicrobiales bacterium]|nr:D-alanyl-D-alanine carboxypeptidase [Acidimicrobiales bacterium]
MQRLLLPAVLLVLAVGALLLSNRADSSPEPPSVVPELTSPATPILSARRVPELLVGEQAKEALDADMSAILASSPPDTCLVVVDRAGNELSTPLNARQLVTPASNLKIVTALAALIELGPDYRFQTRVVADGPIVDGVVQGNLIIVGSGDPVISTGLYTSTFDPSKPQIFTSAEALADLVVETGITQVTGGVLGDDWRYDDQRVVTTWPTRYAEQGQVGPLSALLLNDGFAVFPESTDLNLGLAPPVRAEDPAAHFAASFDDLLEQRGVTVLGGSARTEGPTSITDKQELGVIESAPLSDLVRELLAGSDNTTAELLVKELGVHATGSGTTFDGLLAIQ